VCASFSNRAPVTRARAPRQASGALFPSIYLGGVGDAGVGPSSAPAPTGVALSFSGRKWEPRKLLDATGNAYYIAITSANIRANI
jgi:hypothetical protein